MTTQDIAKRLMAAGIDNAQGEAEWLKKALSGEALQAAVEQRCAHYPVQYILGIWPFYREEYEVNEHCLIPRQDTEILVDTAVNMLPNGARFLDLCTGSGCIAISLLANRPDTVGTGIDLFPETLAVAERNSHRNGVGDRLELSCHDVLCTPPQGMTPNTLDAILSNPPYIRADVIPTLQTEVQFEPRAALLGGEDGLVFYRAILDQWAPLLKADGLILFEIGYDQGEAITALAAKHGFTCTIKKDFGGNDRVAILQKKLTGYHFPC